MSAEQTRVQELTWPNHAQLLELKTRAAREAHSSLDKVHTVYSPYRVCPIGAHVDHQGGHVSASAISGGVVLCFVPSTHSQVALSSTNFEGRVAFDVGQVPPAKRGCHADESANWGNFPRGAVFAFAAKGTPLQRGLTGVLWAPPGLDSSGISSSAAVGVAYIKALAHVNGLMLGQPDVIELDRIIENEYLGLRNGVLDQSAIVLSGLGTTLTLIDCKTRQWQQVTPPWEQQAGARAPFRVILAFSGLRAALASGASFNTRVAECVEAAKKLQDLTGVDKSTAPQPILGHFTHEDFAANEAALDEVSARRARHFFSETSRVQQGAGAWAEGNLQLFGQLMCQSGISSIDNYEVGTPHLIALQHILHTTPGVYGARFSGAGTRGACVALVEGSRVQDVAAHVLREYLKQFPDMQETAHVVITDFGRGAWLE